AQRYGLAAGAADGPAGARPAGRCAAAGAAAGTAHHGRRCGDRPRRTDRRPPAVRPDAGDAPGLRRRRHRRAARIRRAGEPADRAPAHRCGRPAAVPVRPGGHGVRPGRRYRRRERAVGIAAGGCGHRGTGRAVPHLSRPAEPEEAYVTQSVLRTENLTLGYGGADVVTDMTFDVPTGAVTSIIGPNGCGKSTLLRGLGRLIAPRSGRVLLDGVPIGSQPTRQVARRISILPQSPAAPPGLTVADLVSRGRHPRQRWYEQFSVLDEKTLRHA